MPGINHASGGWKGGNGGPWGQGPRNTGSGGGSNPPDLEELLRRSQDRLDWRYLRQAMANSQGRNARAGSKRAIFSQAKTNTSCARSSASAVLVHSRRKNARSAPWCAVTNREKS